MLGVKKLQDFSKAMIGPVLYLPVIGLLIALFSMTTNKIWVAEESSLYLLGKYVSSMLWAIMNNLGFFFCLGLAGGLAKTRKAEAAFVAAMTWFMYLAANNSWLTLTQRLAAGSSNAQLYGSGQTFIFGFQVIDMGVFLGIILGCAVAFIHNRFVDIEFRGAFSIYGNSKLVLIVMIPLVGVFAIATVYVWPIVEHGISALTGVMKTFGAVGVFLYGFLNRFLIPTGLHHLIWSPFVFTSIGGQLLIDGQTVVGAKPIFLAEIAHSAGPLSDSARFLTYGMVKIFGTAGMALAFYTTARPENKQKLKITLIPLIVTSFLVGITEPFEFLFIFTAPLLWLVYSLLDGFFQMLAWLLDVRVCATNGIIDFIVYNIPAGAHLTRWPVFVALGLMETATMFYIGKFLILRFKMRTPGQEQQGEGANQPASVSAPDRASGEQVILGLGGKENVCSVENCFTRLRVDVRDPALIQEQILKTSGGTSVIIKGNHVQVIYGLGVNKIRNAVNRYLDVHE
ncbi:MULTISPECIES: PTS transporter subunit EIIC [Klebsiella]|uniref:PTS system protein n=1 Tax=Klebsiella michiganensis TaxID=1134687 RepID=A0A7H4PJH1_9ENTR|nr:MULTISPECIES: PTS transporter subunit EIIC [Klebsiella]MBS5175423.1 PTS transporter subunit EIIC [Klebsiella oxytoca]ELT9744828.1 PTS transporter subunit EIIC [Klebsiella michiganensis]MBL0811912.1 PTS transporter subunit EIIC [Klebsiella michiganensis]MBZ6555882.1 PTS glucose transporter subunit IIBC [Klebsiella michiganensis]MBZ6646473.1 PTS glucose transporter subunit IIBC [Klebsiella michiganensis]